MAEITPLPSVKFPVSYRETESGKEIAAESYSLLIHARQPYISLSVDGQLMADFFTGSSVETDTGPNIAYGYDETCPEETDDGAVVFVILEDGSAPVTQEWKCYAERIEIALRTSRTGELERIRYFGGVLLKPDLFGQSMSQHYFKQTFNLQPSEMERRTLSAEETTEITTSGMWRPGQRREYLISPFCYGFQGVHTDKWLMAGISAPTEQQNFTRFIYDVHEDGFSLVLEYDKYPLEGDEFTSPTLVLQFADKPLEQGLPAYVEAASKLGHLSVYKKPLEYAQSGITVCTWGEQLERCSRILPHHPGATPRDFCTEPVVRDILRVFAAHDVPVSEVIADDSWQLHYGTNTPDPAKFPDLAKFTEELHAHDIRLLLWLKLFAANGLPVEQCILDPMGKPIAADPTNPEYLENLRSQISWLSNPRGIGVDGYKVDFLAQLPNGPGLRWHGKERGFAALHNVLRVIHEAAHTENPSSLLQVQTVSPWFGDIIDQVRLNDTNDTRNVIDDMDYRSKLARILLPFHSQDPDGWPMPDIPTSTRYIRRQPEQSGKVTALFATSLNGVPLPPSYYDALRRAASQLVPPLPRAV